MSKKDNRSQAALQRILELSKNASGKTTSTHQFNFIRSLPPLKSLKRLAFNGWQHRHSKGKKRDISLSKERSYAEELNLCDLTLESKYHPQHKKELEGKRVAPWRFKEKQLAESQLKKVRLSSPSLEANQHRFSHDASDEEKEERKQTQEWQDYIKSRQEQSFNMNRVIKYLST